MKNKIFLLGIFGAMTTCSALPIRAVSVPLIVREDRTAPLTAISVLVRAGDADETPETSGWRRFLAEAMLRAVQAPADAKSPADAKKSLDAAALQRAADDLGAQVGVSVTDDAIELWAVGQSSNQKQLLDLLLNIAEHPRLADDDINAARDRLTARLEDEEGDVAGRAIGAVRAQLYRDARGEVSAYGLPPLGTAASLKAVSNDRLRELYKVYFNPSHFSAAAAGDVDEAALRAALSTSFPDISAPPGEDAAPYFEAPDAAKPPLVVRQARTQTAWIFIGYATGGLTSEDLPALRVLAAALGETPGSRLASRLLASHPAAGTPAAQQVAVQWTPRRFSSELIAFAQVDTQDVDEAKNAMLDEVRKLRETNLAPYELERAKNFARGNWALERENLRERAFQSALAQISGAPSDAAWPSRLENVSAGDVRRVAEKYLQPYAVALILPRN